MHDMPFELDQRGVSGASHFFEEIRYPSEVIVPLEAILFDLNILIFLFFFFGLWNFFMLNSCVLSSLLLLSFGTFITQREVRKPKISPKHQG